MKKILIFIMLAFSCSTYAQVDKSIEEQLMQAVENMSQEQKDSLAILFKAMETSFKEQQIHNIGGIPFGISREEALPKLRNKYGQPEYNPKSTVISFKGIKFAGKDFSAVHFLFESDGTNSYLNACIFLKEAKTKAEASAIMEDLKKDLEKRYNVSEAEGENGFMTYGGGISPVWDGNIATFNDEYLTGWHTDVIEYERSLVELYGNRYGVRLIYGPYNYIKEEF